MSDLYHHPQQIQPVWLNNVDFRGKPHAGANELLNAYRRADADRQIDPRRIEAPTRTRQKRIQEHRLTGPVRLIQNVAQAWSLTNEELAGLLTYRDRNFAADLLRGGLLLGGADRQDRARLMCLIHETLADLFVDPADEGRWMRTPLPLLDGSAPLDYMVAHRIPGMVSIRELVEQRLANR
jgi:hypothetical protein